MSGNSMLILHADMLTFFLENKQKKTPWLKAQLFTSDIKTPGKTHFPTEQYGYFYYFGMKTYIVGTSVALLMSTHKICFNAEIRNIYWYQITPLIWTISFIYFELKYLLQANNKPTRFWYSLNVILKLAKLQLLIQSI